MIAIIRTTLLIFERTSMRTALLFALAVLSFSSYTIACSTCSGDSCCAGSGISYCDSSSGRYVCKNGDYSTCYCTRHAVMEMERFRGCCMWHGGVYKVNGYGAVICNDSTVSELCSAHNAPEKIASW
jgi:hypothetical protein